MPPFSAPEILDRRRSGKVGTHEEWEKLRRQLVTHGATYDQRLPIELRGQVAFVVQALQDYARTIERGDLDFWTVMTAIKRRGIEREWNTEVFSLSSIDALFDRLRSL